MLAEVFLRERFEQGYAKGKANGEAQILSAMRQVAERRGWDPEVIQGVIDGTREILRNEECPNCRA